MSRLIIWNISLCLYSNKIFHGVSRDKKSTALRGTRKKLVARTELTPNHLLLLKPSEQFPLGTFPKTDIYVKSDGDKYSISLMSSEMETNTVSRWCLLDQRIFTASSEKKKNKNGWNLNETYKLGNLWSSLKVPSEITGTSEDWSKCIPT